MHLSEHLEKRRKALCAHTSDFTFLLNGITRLQHMYLIRSAQEIGLSSGQPPVLMSLAAENLQTQKELCEWIRIKPASMTNVLQRMERDGLIARIRDAKDMRNMRVSITDTGYEKFLELFEKGSYIDEICLKGFCEEEKEQVIEFLSRIMENMDREINERGDDL